MKYYSNAYLSNAAVEKRFSINRQLIEEVSKLFVFLYVSIVVIIPKTKNATT